MTLGPAARAHDRFGDLLGNRRGLGRRPDPAPQPPEAAPYVDGELHADDWGAQGHFDAGPGLHALTDEQLVDLARRDWGGCESADNVAYACEQEDVAVEHVLAYVRSFPDSDRRRPGFECHVNPDQAQAWVLSQRPQLAERLGLDARA